MKYILALVALLVVAVGCSTANEGAPENNFDKSGQKEAPVVNDPKQVKEGGSYVVKPADPSDPKYKADPRLAGGG